MGDAFHSVSNIVAGDNITVDTTDPHNPVVSASGGGGGGIESIVPGQNIIVDATDPANPIVTFGGSELPFITIVPDVGMGFFFNADTYIQITAGIITMSAGGESWNFGNDTPLLMPHNVDVPGNLNPVIYGGCIIYDSTLKKMMYSDGLNWLPLGFGTVQSITAGTGIAVDSSDPAHPIVAVSP